MNDPYRAHFAQRGAHPHPREGFSPATRGALIASGIIVMTTACLVMSDFHDQGTGAFVYLAIAGPLLLLVIVIAFLASPTFKQWRMRRTTRKMFRLDR